MLLPSALLTKPGSAFSSTYLNQAPQQVAVTIAAGQTSATATLPNAVGANAFIIWQGSTYTGTPNQFPSAMGYLQLTNSTTVTATRQSTTSDLTLYGVVIDPKAALVTGIRQGTVNLSSSASATATITSVDTTRSAVFYLGSKSNQTGDTPNQSFDTVTLTNATTVTGQVSTAGTANVVAFVVVEFAAAAIQSRQQVTQTNSSTSSTTDTTISAVTMANTMLVYGGVRGGHNTALRTQGYFSLTSTTNVRFTIYPGVGNSTTRNQNCTAIEFKSGVLSSMQRGTVGLSTGQTTNTATISSADPTKSIANFTGNYPVIVDGVVAITNGWFNQQQASLVQTNATTLTATKSTIIGNAADTGMVGYEVSVFN